MREFREVEAEMRIDLWLRAFPEAKLGPLVKAALYFTLREIFRGISSTIVHVRYAENLSEFLIDAIRAFCLRDYVNAAGAQTRELRTD